MKITSAIAIFFLIFVSVAFVTLSIGVRTDEEAGTAKVPGQADSAPHQFDLRRHLTRAALVAAVLTAIYVLNYVEGWVTMNALDFYPG